MQCAFAECLDENPIPNQRGRELEEPTLPLHKGYTFSIEASKFIKGYTRLFRPTTSGTGRASPRRLLKAPYFLYRLIGRLGNKVIANADH